jgi:hypothetical protein
VHECAIPTALRASTDDHTLVEESRETFIPLYPFALSDKVVGTPALAGRRLVPQTSAVGTREAEDTFLAPAF